MIIAFEIPENPDFLQLLKELKEIRLQMSAYKYAIKLFIASKSMQKRNYTLMYYTSEMSRLRGLQKINRKIIKEYYEIR